MNINFTKPHTLGLEILRKLSKTTGRKFNDLLIENLESEHMNYHLKKLISLGLVSKKVNIYTLTNNGKDYIGLLDDNKEIVEKQPKVSILLNIRKLNKEGKVEHLLSRRLIQPYLNKVGRLTGKVRFGETIIQAATRELYEETGLVTSEKKCKLVQVYHKLRWNELTEPVQDNIFFICSIDNPTGNLITNTSVQENFWITKKEFANRKDIDVFDSLTLNDKDDPKDIWFNESKAIADGY